MPMLSRYCLRIIAGVVLYLPACVTLARGAELSVGATTVAPGGAGLISVSYAAQGNQVVGVQFDFGYDSATMSINPIAGAAVRAAGKGRYYADLPANLHRLLIAGWNQTALSDDTALTFYVNVSPNASQGVYNVTLTNVLGVDSSGNPVPMSYSAGIVTVSGNLGDSPSIQSSGVLSGGSLLSGAVSPGDSIALIGSAIGPAIPALLQLTSSNTVSTVLNNTQVSFDGIPAPLTYAGLNQINAVVPFEISGQITAMTISQNGQLIGPITLPVAASTPAVLTQDGSGVGAALALNPDLSLNSALNPAPAGSTVALYVVGAGQSTPGQVSGYINVQAGNTNLPVTATIGGIPATVGYAGPAPFLLAGATQVNLTIPSAVAPSAAAPVSIQVGSATTQSDIFISVSNSGSGTH